jgi:hypothetical protein
MKQASMQQFRAAPWPTSLKVISLVATAVLAGVSWAAFRAIPRGTRVPFAETFGTVVAATFPLITIVALLFVVTGYEVGPGELRIQRLLWSTRVGLDGMARAWADPKAMTCSIRIWGNGGLYSITGYFQSKALGRYRAFVTDPACAVVLVLAGRTVVVSPAEPRAFLQALSLPFPGLDTAPR